MVPFDFHRSGAFLSDALDSEYAKTQSPNCRTGVLARNPDPKNATITSVLRSSLVKSMVLPPVPLPDTLKGVDDLIRSGFEEFRELWFTRLLVSTALVVGGLLFEAPEIWHESVEAIRVLCHSCKPKRDIPAWMKLVGTLGWVLIVVGVTGEFVADSFVSKADGFVQKFDEILLADAQRKTGFASERAASAFERAARTEREASQENERAAKAEQQAIEENARAAKALEAAEVARKNAEGFQLQIAQANERAANAEQRAAEATLELAKLKMPRSLSKEQQERIASKINPFAGTPFDLWVTTDSESAVLMELIDAVLRSAEWKFNQPEGAGLLYANKAGLITASGVEIHFPKEHEEWGPAITVLTNALSAEGIATFPFADTTDAQKNMKRDRIHVVIGSKPIK